MRPSRLLLSGLILTLALGLVLSERAEANVFASAVRVTQEGSDGPFDGSFTDGTGAEIRFVLSDRADSVTVNIWTATNPTTLVRTITAYSFTAGDTSIIWDGDDNSATPVGSGEYRVVVTTFDQGYADYTEIYYAQPAIFTRGVTAITNPALRNFGFIFSASNGGYVTGIARHSADGLQWGDVKGNAKLSNTGATVGPLNLRYSSEADQEGYVYLIGRDNREVYRYHTDTLDVALVDSGGYETIIQGLAVRGTGANRYLAVAGYENVYGFPLGNNAGYFGPKDMLLDGDTTWTFWDVAWGRSPDDIMGDSTLFVTFFRTADVSEPGVAKFDLRGYDGTPLTMADAVWTASLDTAGRATTMVLAKGIDMMGYEDMVYFVIARPADAGVQGIYKVAGLNTTPSIEFIYADKADNIAEFRGDITLDAAGNIIFFENSNEEVVLISPPTGQNSFFTSGLDTILVFDAEPISDVRASTVDYYVPDRLGDTVTVAGAVTSVNFTASANRFSYYIQDETGGINITKGSEPLGGPVYDIGDRLLATGRVGQFAGLTQLEIIGNLADNVKLLTTGLSVDPMEVTIQEYLQDPEAYEGLYIKLMGVTKDATSPVWPGAGSSANMVVTDGFETLILRLDSDTEIPGQTEPTYPVNILGVGTQFSSIGVVDDGYQITPSFYADFEQDVNVLPDPRFALLSPPDGATIVLDSTTQSFTISWEAAVDLNDDPIIYQWIPLGFPPVNAGQDTFVVRTGEQLRTYLGAADTVELMWTVVTKDAAPDLVYCQDTSMVRIVRGTITGVGSEEEVPTAFALSQNYPNPFNPTTTIRYALPVQSAVTLRVYDVIGREVATLVNGVIPAGYHDVAWTTTNSSGALLASGMYFYRIEARPSDGSEPFVQLKKMMLLK